MIGYFSGIFAVSRVLVRGGGGGKGGVVSKRIHFCQAWAVRARGTSGGPLREIESERWGGFGFGVGGLEGEDLEIYMGVGDELCWGWEGSVGGVAMEDHGRGKEEQRELGSVLTLGAIGLGWVVGFGKSG